MCAVLLGAAALSLWVSAAPSKSSIVARSAAQPSVAAPLTAEGEPGLAVSGPVVTGQNSLTIPTTFAVTRPEKQLTTPYKNYFITGTSDPTQPVYFGDEEIQRQGTLGTFGVYVDLAMGTNTFVLRQGNDSHTVTIVRTEEPGISPIGEIQQNTMVPAVMSGVKAGQELEVGCVAPSGATVKATFEGSTVKLRQTNTDTKPGMPATFVGAIVVEGSYDQDVTQPAGKVSYEMSYNGGTQSYKSTGQVYVAGKNSGIAVEVTSYAGFVYPDREDLAVFKEKMKTGARDYVAGQDNDYFQLASGGYIPKSMVRIVEGKVSVKNQLTSATASYQSRNELFTFSGSSSPAYATKIADNTFFLTLYNTSGTPSLDVSGSKLASSVSVEENGSAVTYSFPLKDRVWGYDVAFSGGNTLLTLRRSPSLSSGAKPFEGLTILLDPGHGGHDPGAAGLAGKTGPSEAAVNLANAVVTRDLLVQMGAKVYMTRDGNDYLSLDDRLLAIETYRPDLFISLHHNSMAENVDTNQISGTELYYHTPLSHDFADTMMAELAAGLGRKDRGAQQSYYRVTLMPYAPALLLELGFMSNPVEYEKSVSPSEMAKVASAVAKGIEQTLA